MQGFAAISFALVSGASLALAARQRAKSRSLGQQVKALEGSLRGAQDALRLRSEFVATISHELRTPLNAIINVPEGLLERFVELRIAACRGCSAAFELEEGEQVGPDSACPQCRATGTFSISRTWRYRGDLGVVAENLARVSRSGRNLLALINNVLDFSKLEAGKVELHVSDFFVGEVLCDVLELLQPVAQKSSVLLRLASPPSPELRLRADPVKFSQIFINLIGNAIKFSPAGGEVSVALTTDGERCEIAVQDRGIGIAPEHHAAIFESFRQVEDTGAKRFGGTGLGLAISRSYVELHGGTIRVESALGQGATFRVTLPLRGPSATDETPTVLAAGMTDSTVLILDDEPFAIENLRLALEPLGCKVQGIRDPRALEAALARSPPDVLFVDVVMPHLSGLEVVRALRQRPGAPPVIVSSAHGANAEVVRALGAEWLEKPWTAETVQALVRRVLQRSRTVVLNANRKAS